MSPSAHTRSFLRAAAAVLAAAAIGFGASTASAHVVGEVFLFIPMCASATAALAAGAVAGWLSAALSLAAFLATRPGPIAGGDAERMALFAVAAAALCHVCGRARAGRRRAQAQRESARREAERWRAVQAITAALAGAQTTGEVAEVMLTSGVEALGLVAAGVFVASEGRLVALRATGALDALHGRRPLVLRDAVMPVADAWRTGAAVLLPSRAEMARRYPDLVGCLPAAAEAWAALPLAAGAAPFGVVVMGFPDRRPCDEADRRALLGLASKLARALERARLLESERAAHQRADLLLAQLRESGERKDQFLAVLSHELRNPLAPIRNAVDVLGRVPGGSPRAAWAREIVERQVAHLARLVDDLLDVTRISRGKIRLQREPVDVAEAVRRAGRDHRALLEGRGIALAVEADGELWVDADPTRVAQVIGNLLQNAAKFTPGGGRVWLRARRAGGDVTVEVQDTGAGLDRALIPDLFRPFAQAERTLARSTGGLGLGLALVKGLVELHGGEVAARSPGPGQGATFTVRLPGGAVRGVGDRPERPAPTVARRVLIVEDNDDAADTLAELLRLEGHQVQVARDGAAGVAAARASGPEIVLCDLGLPGVSGYEVARRLRADPALGATVLVALTGYAGPEDRRRSAEAGFDRHLAKPPSLEALRQALAARRPGDGAAGDAAGPSPAA